MKKEKEVQRSDYSRGHRVTGRYHVYKGDIYTAVFRGSLVIIGIILQFFVMLLLSLFMMQYSIILYLLLELVGVIFAVYIIYTGESYRHFWLVIMLMLPVVGMFMYMMWGSRLVNARSRKRLCTHIEEAKTRLLHHNGLIETPEMEGNGQIACARYLLAEGLPLYGNTDVRYYPLGDDMKEDFLRDLRCAKERIYLEFFIVLRGEVYDEVEEILSEKVKEGVDVRLLIDDVGSIRQINRKFKRRMKELGIKLLIFAPIHKDLTKLSLNYRNHQKIAVIDDRIGYTGGINLSDEYFNIYPKYGHWKDTAVRFEGEATASLAVTFVAMWNYTAGNRSDLKIPTDAIDEFAGTVEDEDQSLVQPFYTGPFKVRYNNADMVYQSLMRHAKRYLWITTPYLVLDRVTTDALVRAARSGIDVRIYTPRHYDKWYVYRVTESNYGMLLREGVRIFEYVPGFIHAKNILVDGECAVCGSINLDYRSLYFHYESGAVFYGGKTVEDIRADFIATEKLCEEIVLEKWKRRPERRKLTSRILRFLSPLF